MYRSVLAIGGYRYCLTAVHWIHKAMGKGCNPFSLGFRIYIGLVFIWGIQPSWSLNDEGQALLEFRAAITSDPHGAFENWNLNDYNPCKWSGVSCVEGKVQMLDLNGLSLEGTLSPELGKLSHLKSLVLCKNNFFGTIPKELGDLTKLELLDLRENNLTGSIPAEISRMLLLKHLLLCDNKIEGSVYDVLVKLRLLAKSIFVENQSSAMRTAIGCMNRKFGYWYISKMEPIGNFITCLYKLLDERPSSVWESNFKLWNKVDSLVVRFKRALMKYLNYLVVPLFKLGKASLLGYEENCCDNLPSSSETEIIQNEPNLVNSAARRLLDQSSNLAAAPINGGPPIQIISLPTTLSSGSFSAVPDDKMKQNLSPAPVPNPSHDTSKQGQSSDASSGEGNGPQSSVNGASGNLWKYIIIIAVVAVLVIIVLALFFLWQRKGAKAIRPFKTGISGQLQKAFITGVPKLNRAELETACEDFSNIVCSLDHCTIFKGTLSSGVEIGVVSTLITSSKDWSRSMERSFRRKIDMLSRVNHKNFTNLIGYCEEQEPFTRTMVFEYAPNGTVYEHLHVKEVEHLDWTVRMRIVMGTAYCLQYMLHDLNPPVALSDFTTCCIYLTDDFAAKVTDIPFGKKFTTSPRSTDDESSMHSELPPNVDPETNVYSFGVLLLEIISARISYTKEQGHILDWAAEYLKDKGKISSLIDPTLESFKNNELEVLCEVIQDCTQSDPRSRPTMREVTSKLREVINISPEQAVPRLSPLWWAELEILSVDAP